MAMFSAIVTVWLSTSAWAWSNGSPWLESTSLASPDLCLYLGLFGFFGGIAVFTWEYIRGDIRTRPAFPFRSMGYFVMGLPLLFQFVTALAGVLWMNTTIFSLLAWSKKETYERRKRRGPKDERTLSQKVWVFWNVLEIRDYVVIIGGFECLKLLQNPVLEMRICVI